MENIDSIFHAPGATITYFERESDPQKIENYKLAIQDVTKTRADDDITVLTPRYDNIQDRKNYMFFWCFASIAIALFLVFLISLGLRDEKSNYFTDNNII